MTTTEKAAYVVTVKLEDKNPETGRVGPVWVARDVKGDWRACVSDFAKEDEGYTPTEAARAMFHENEIGGIRDWADGTAARVVIETE